MKTLLSLCLLMAAVQQGRAQGAPAPAQDHDGMLRLKPSEPNRPLERKRKEAAPAEEPAAAKPATAPEGLLTLAPAGAPPKAPAAARPRSLEPFPGVEGKPLFSGYDPVVWQAAEKAVAGSEKFAHTYEGKQILFSRPEFRAAFIREPRRFLPQFGGYCAFHMAKGEAVAGQAQAFRVVSGRIYLFASEAFARSWERDASTLIPAAEDAWAAAGILR